MAKPSDDSSSTPPKSLRRLYISPFNQDASSSSIARLKHAPTSSRQAKDLCLITPSTPVVPRDNHVPHRGPQRHSQSLLLFTKTSHRSFKDSTMEEDGWKRYRLGGVLVLNDRLCLDLLERRHCGYSLLMSPSESGFVRRMFRESTRGNDG